MPKPKLKDEPKTFSEAQAPHNGFYTELVPGDLAYEAKRIADKGRGTIKDRIEALSCPNDDYWLTMTAFAHYIHHNGAIADYSKWECRHCGYVLHRHDPPENAPSSDTDDFPL